MTLSPLERLPAELIQPIFLSSGPNLAFAQSSPHIAAKLSTGYIYDAVCTHYLTQDLYSRAEQSKSQSCIFASKWMTWNYFKSFMLKTYEANGCLCGKTNEEGCFDAQWPPDFEDATNMVFSRSHLPALSYVKCRLPTKLLHGPWDQGKVQFLRFLLWTSSMTVDWANAEVRKIALEGKMEAIREKNLEVVEMFNHNRRLGKAPNMTLVRFAVLEADCDRSIVYDTMATARKWGLRGEDWECPKLDAWCKERSEAGDPKGQWLSLKLKELRSTYDTSNATWNNGAGNGGSLYGHIRAETGDYDGGNEDTLMVNKHKWTQEIVQKGWFVRTTDRCTMIHGLQMSDCHIYFRSVRFLRQKNLPDVGYMFLLEEEEDDNNDYEE